MTHLKQRLLPVLCLFAAMAGSQCYAGLNGHGHGWSWSEASDNGQYVFVSLFPTPVKDQVAHIKSLEDDPPYFTRASAIAQVERLHKTYPCTGMYLNNGSNTPIWTTNEKVYAGTPTSDGRYLVDLFEYDYMFTMEVTEPSRTARALRDFEIIGYPAWALYGAAGKGFPYMDTCVIDPNSEHVLVTWNNKTTSTVRLDDFAIVQSNVLPHAFSQLFTTMQGITVFLVFVLITCGVAYGIARCFMGGSAKESRR
ncbi:hypothetical protein [Aeoliella sp. SH292]|uniref:hypothetical protein n=1 Tax=Aeoliella sp. SH292 TaxID=3454464 RepID=UPI003F982081